MNNLFMHRMSEEAIESNVQVRQRSRRPLLTILKSFALGGTSGQSMLENAVAIPAFLLIMIGIFDFSIFLVGYENAEYACRAGARYAAVHSSTSLSPCTATTASNIVQQYLWAPPADSTIKVQWSNGNVIGSTVTVSVSVTDSVKIPFATLAHITYKGSAQATVMR